VASKRKTTPFGVVLLLEVTPRFELGNEGFAGLLPDLISVDIHSFFCTRSIFAPSLHHVFVDFQPLIPFPFCQKNLPAKPLFL